MDVFGSTFIRKITVHSDFHLSLRIESFSVIIIFLPITSE